MFRWFLFIFTMGAVCSWADESAHKIVWLLSGPRTLSTVFLRMVESRGDFIIYNESTIPLYNKARYKDHTEWFCSNSYNTFEEVKESIFSSAEKSNVFIKDMSFSTFDYLLEDTDLLKNDSCHFIFLVRNPHHSTISLYKKYGSVGSEMSEWVGLKKLYEEYLAIKQLNPNGTKIIFSEQFYNKPRAVIEAFCESIQIPFREDALVWKNYDQSFTGRDEWHEQKVGGSLFHWHGEALSSTHMQRPHDYEIDSEGMPTFSEITNLEDRLSLQEIYEENLSYYRYFLQEEDPQL